MPKCYFKSQSLDNESNDPIWVDCREAKNYTEREGIAERFALVMTKNNLLYDATDLKLYNRSNSYGACLYPEEKDSSGRVVGVLVHFELPAGTSDVRALAKECEDKTIQFVEGIGRTIDPAIVTKMYETIGEIHDRKRKKQKIALIAISVGVLIGLIYLISK